MANKAAQLGHTSAAIFPAIWVGLPIYELVVDGKTPSIEFQLIMAVVFTP